MLLRPTNVDKLRQALFGLPADMKVEAAADNGVTEKTVEELRARVTWSSRLVVETPRERYPESTVKIRKSDD
jgi:hypothetical protein